MIILGIDPGVERMGYGVIDYSGGTHKPLAYGLISTSRELSHGDRLAELHAALTGLISKYKPDLVAVEKLFFSKNIKTAMKVGEARGVVILSAAEHGIPVVELTPNEVKVSVTGYGKADKRQVQKMITTLLNLKETPKPDDVSDALAIAFTGAFYRKMLNYGKK